MLQYELSTVFYNLLIKRLEDVLRHNSLPHVFGKSGTILDTTGITKQLVRLLHSALFIFIFVSPP